MNSFIMFIEKDLRVTRMHELIVLFSKLLSRASEIGMLRGVHRKKELKLLCRV